MLPQIAAPQNPLQLIPYLIDPNFTPEIAQALLPATLNDQAILTVFYTACAARTQSWNDVKAQLSQLIARSLEPDFVCSIALICLNNGNCRSQGELQEAHNSILTEVSTLCEPLPIQNLSAQHRMAFLESSLLFLNEHESDTEIRAEGWAALICQLPEARRSNLIPFTPSFIPGELDPYIDVCLRFSPACFARNAPGQIEAMRVGLRQYLGMLFQRLQNRLCVDLLLEAGRVYAFGRHLEIIPTPSLDQFIPGYTQHLLRLILGGHRCSLPVVQERLLCIFTDCEEESYQVADFLGLKCSEEDEDEFFLDNLLGALMGYEKLIAGLEPAEINEINRILLLAFHKSQEANQINFGPNVLEDFMKLEISQRAYHFLRICFSNPNLDPMHGYNLFDDICRYPDVCELIEADKPFYNALRAYYLSHVTAWSSIPQDEEKLRIYQVLFRLGQ